MEINKQLIKYINEKQFEEALKLFNDNKDYFIKQNFINAVRFNVEILIALEKYDQVEEVFLSYLDRPYISQEVEEFLKDFPAVYRKNIREEIAFKNTTSDINLKLLYSKNVQDHILFVKQIISERTIEKYTSELISLLKIDKIESNLIFLVCNALIYIDYNKDVDFVKENKTYTINPSKCIMPLSNDDKEYNELVEYCIEDSKDVTISKIVREYLAVIDIYFFPNKMPFIDRSYIKEAVTYCVNMAFGIRTLQELTEKAKSYVKILNGN